jgi:hypothetical protein
MAKKKKPALNIELGTIIVRHQLYGEYSEECGLMIDVLLDAGGWDAVATALGADVIYSPIIMSGEQIGLIYAERTEIRKKLGWKKISKKREGEVKYMFDHDLQRLPMPRAG